MNDLQIQETGLIHELPIDLTLMANNSAGPYTIPKGTKCLIVHYSPDKIAVYITKKTWEQHHPYGKNSSFGFTMSSITGLIVEQLRFEWENPQLKGQQVPDEQYTALREYLAVNEGRQLIKLIQAEKARLAQNQKVPIDELRQLVFVTYSCSMISIGRACELLCIDIIQFRDEWNAWVKQNPRMQEIYDSYNPLADESNE